jgi:PTH1 family peptidyl-tRNA hydrolase
MNLSGCSVSRLADKFKVSLDNLIVIHDDLDLPSGKIRIRQGGGSGGHKGINSIIDELGSREFIRIRFGIGRPESSNEDDIVDFVLSNFTPEEKEIIKPSVILASEAISCLLEAGLEAAMNKYN